MDDEEDLILLVGAATAIFVLSSRSSSESNEPPSITQAIVAHDRHGYATITIQGNNFSPNTNHVLIDGQLYNPGGFGGGLPLSPNDFGFLVLMINIDTFFANYGDSGYYMLSVETPFGTSNQVEMFI